MQMKSKKLRTRGWSIRQTVRTSNKWCGKCQYPGSDLLPGWPRTLILVERFWLEASCHLDVQVVDDKHVFQVDPPRARWTYEFACICKHLLKVRTWGELIVTRDGWKIAPHLAFSVRSVYKCFSLKFSEFSKLVSSKLVSIRSALCNCTEDLDCGS